MSPFAKWIGILITIIPVWAQAQPWAFTNPVDVTKTYGEKIFHHLESSGRHNIAVAGNTVAVAWEDNRDGTPRIYLARKGINDEHFTDDLKVSGPGEAYEPSLVALNSNQFALAWEENTQIHLRIVSSSGPGPVITLGKGESMQASLSKNEQGLLLAYSLRDGRYSRIWLQHIKIEGNSLLLKKDCPVEAKSAKDEQLYPAIITLKNKTIIAWEDRRPGHTIIMAAQSENNQICRFNSPQRISDKRTVRNITYGKGFGVSRVALATYGIEQALAVWADKRNFREGYDIYSAHYLAVGKQLFGQNIRVQDSFGGVAQQWHATVAGNNNGSLVVGWDDNRDGDPSIFLSWLENDEWSEDITVPGADGDGTQNHPTISLDKEGNLHLAWIHRSTISGPTRLKYTFGQLSN